jgi:uncharacterized protein (DUF1810 family)
MESAMDKDFNLDRFVNAQDPVYSDVLAELRTGKKRTHWMWFVFPQIAGLGQSERARIYAIASSDEAAAYLAHPVLGPRLRECARLVALHSDKAIEDIFDPPDDRKFHSSMTLFNDIAPDEAVFQTCLDEFFGGRPDEATLARL